MVFCLGSLVDVSIPSFPCLTRHVRPFIQAAPTANYEITDLKKRVVNLEVKDSCALSFTDYYKEKAEQGQVNNWNLNVDATKLKLPSPDKKFPVLQERDRDEFLGEFYLCKAQRRSPEGSSLLI